MLNNTIIVEPFKSTVQRLLIRKRRTVILSYFPEYRFGRPAKISAEESYRRLFSVSGCSFTSLISTGLCNL